MGHSLLWAPKYKENIFLLHIIKKKHCPKGFTCCFPSRIILCRWDLFYGLDNWVIQNGISSNSMFYLQCKQCVTFIDILWDSLVIWVTGFGKIRNIILSCFIFDGRGVSGMCVYDSFCPFRWLNRDCPLQLGVPYIGNEC